MIYWPFYSIETVDVNAVFLLNRPATLTGIILLMWTSNSFQCSVNFPAESKITTGSKKLFYHMIVTIGVLAKASTYLKLSASRFLKNHLEIKKSRTIKGLKLSFWVSSYLNQRLIVRNLQNDSVTDDKQTTTITLFSHVRWGLKNVVILQKDFLDEMCKGLQLCYCSCV